MVLIGRVRRVKYALTEPVSLRGNVGRTQIVRPCLVALMAYVRKQDAVQGIMNVRLDKFVIR